MPKAASQTNRAWRNARASLLGTLGIAIFAASLAACGNMIPNATVASASSIAPAAGEATIVFVQPTKPYLIHVLDAKGQLVGQLYTKSHTAIHVPPGPVRLYCFVQGLQADRLDGNVEAGKVYFASASYFNEFSCVALNPRSNDNRWALKDQWVRGTPNLALDSQKLPEATRVLGDPMVYMRRADARVDGMDAPHRAERTIQPNDCLTVP